jgi:hypothetical protein
MMEVFIQITVYNDYGEVKMQLAKAVESSYGWEVENTFELLGKRVARFVDDRTDG